MRASESAAADRPTPNTPTPAYGPHRGQDGPSEVERLTAALHANQCHPDFTYAITTGGTQIPPAVGQWGSGWQPNPDCPGHGRGTKPANTWWCWRRHRTTEETS